MSRIAPRVGIVQAPGQTRREYLPPAAYDQIPYRNLIPLGLRNVLIAPRCISADHVTHSSLRVMPIIFNVGEADVNLYVG